MTNNPLDQLVNLGTWRIHSLSLKGSVDLLVPSFTDLSEENDVEKLYIVLLCLVT